MEIKNNNGRSGEMKRIVLGLMVASVLMAAMPVGWAAETAPAGNKMCPISGDKVGGKHFAEYKGKKYGLCCPMCAKKFNKNPEKYLKEMSEEHHHHHGGDH